MTQTHSHDQPQVTDNPSHGSAISSDVHAKHEGHDHDHSYGHSHSHVSNDKKIMAISFIIITAFMLVEFWGGWHFNSLALTADAGHMANDSLSLLLAFLALFLSPKIQKWLALVNGLSLIVIALIILAEALKRWQNPLELHALPMLIIAVLGLLVNLVVAWLMLKSNHENLNIKSAYLHVLADLLGSVVAIIAGLSAYFLQWQWVDVVASVLLSLFILRSGVQVSGQAWQSLKS